MLEEAIGNLSLEKKKTKTASQYRLRRRGKMNYCERGGGEDESGDEFDATKDDEKDEEEEEEEEEDDDEEEEEGDSGTEDELLAQASSEASKVRRLKRSWEVPDTWAARSVPDGLVLRCSDLPDAVAGIFCLKQLPKGTIFGPFVGVTTHDRQDAYNHGYCWDVGRIYF